MTETKRALQIVATGLVVVAGSFISRAARAQSLEVQNAPLTAKERHAVIGEIVTKLNAMYIFPALARTAGDSVRHREEEGAYNQLTTIEAFANALTRDLQEVTHISTLEFGIQNFQLKNQITMEIRPRKK